MKKIITLISILYLPACILNAQYWKLTGNSGTVAGPNFVGTIDSMALMFKVLSTKAGYLDFKQGSPTSFGYQALNIDNGLNNSAFGYQAMLANSAGQNNTAIGYQSLYSNGPAIFPFPANGGHNNSAVGYRSLYSNTTGSNNTATGYQALIKNASGIGNTATGSGALSTNSSGTDNTATGANSLVTNFTGSYNTANGSYCLWNNTTGLGNTASGYYSLFSNTTGNRNVAIGNNSLKTSQQNSGNVAIGDSALASYNDLAFTDYMTGVGQMALKSNTTGFYNTATGGRSLTKNITGYSNTANGANALMENTTGNNNTAVGYFALGGTITGSNNTAIGCASTIAGGSFSNSTAIGYNATVDASDKVVIGSTSVRTIGGYAGWTIFSDGRYKKDIKENVPGLAFINDLRPITYTVNVKGLNEYYDKKRNRLSDNRSEEKRAELEREENEASAIIHNGFIAQDVEKAAKKLNFTFSGVDKPQTKDGLYGLRYDNFVVPLVKAMQELSKMNDDKDTKISDLQAQLTELKTMMEELKKSSRIPIKEKQITTDLKSASLAQNIPNPFNNTTIIHFSLPLRYTSAEIIITDKSGKLLKQINVSGNTTLKIDAATLSAGAYQYSLYADGSLIDTKQMIRAK